MNGFVRKRCQNVSISLSIFLAKLLPQSSERGSSLISSKTNSLLSYFSTATLSHFGQICSSAFQYLGPRDNRSRASRINPVRSQYNKPKGTLLELMAVRWQFQGSTVSSYLWYNQDSYWEKARPLLRVPSCYMQNIVLRILWSTHQC